MPVLDNARHERFAQELAKGASQVAAYEAAGYKPNESHASRLVANGKIADRVSEILAAGAERAEITREMVVRELGRIGFSDIRRVFDSNGALRRLEDLDDESAAAIASVEVVTKRVPGGDKDEVEHVAKIKTWDKRAALVDIAKMQGWHVERHEHTGKDGGPIETADLSERDVAKTLAFILARGSKEQPTVN
jgi:phage terminase small subunit